MSQFPPQQPPPYVPPQPDGRSDALLLVQQLYDAAGNLVDEFQEVVDPAAPAAAPTPAAAPRQSVPAAQQGVIPQISRYLADANDDGAVSMGEAKVFGLGVFVGWLVSRILS